MDTSIIVAIVGVVIGSLGFLFGIYTHFATRKVAKLTYAVSQISDFGVPASFLQDMNRAPVAITVTSRGNKNTENIIGRIRTHNQIEEYEVDPPNTVISESGNEIQFQQDRLNPSQQIRLSLRCSGDPSTNQIEDFSLSHSEGGGIDENQVRSITISFMGLEMEYDVGELKTHLTRIGPIRIRG